jgi:hypothetical protein
MNKFVITKWIAEDYEYDPLLALPDTERSADGARHWHVTELPDGTLTAVAMESLDSIDDVDLTGFSWSAWVDAEPEDGARD